MQENGLLLVTRLTSWLSGARGQKSVICCSIINTRLKIPQSHTADQPTAL